jgi:hypothetical protein
LSQAFADADRASIQQVKVALSSQKIQLANLESKQGFITQNIYGQVEGEKNILEKSQVEDTLKADLESLTHMAGDYLKISVPDWAERTKLKDLAANKMADFALRQNISKSTILEQYQEDKNEGLALTLASLININPELNDTNFILEAGWGLTRLHVMYRFLLAIVTLYKSGFVDRKDKLRLINMVNSYKNKADNPLLNMIESTLSTLNS